MRRFFALTAIFALVFTTCEQPSSSNNPEPSSTLQNLTIRNESSYVLTNVKFSGIPFAVPGSDDLPVSNQSAKGVAENVANQAGYITFTRKDIGIDLRTSVPISFPDQNYIFVFTDNTVVQEQTNTGNQGTLSTISFLSKITVKHGGFTIAKNDIVNLGEAVVNNPKQTDFILENTGSGKLILTGSDPIKISDATEENIFTVVKPSSSEIAAGSSLTFRINFNPKDTQNYTATVTISSNDPDGDFTFTITAVGVPPKPIASVFFGETEIAQNGTIDIGKVFITRLENITVTIKNEGTLPLTLDTANITITGADADTFEATNPGGSISAGGQTFFTIECKPVKEGEHRAIMTIPTNDNDRDPIIIILTVTGEKGSAIPELSQADTPIANDIIIPFDFGRVELGYSKTLVFTIKNAGNISLELTGTPAVVSSNPVFAILIQPVNQTISPETTVSFAMQYTPTAEKEDTGTVTILNNSNDMVFIFTVKGNGYIRKPQITVKQGGDIVSQHGQHSLGTILTNTTRDIAFDIVNSGEADLTIDAVNGSTVNLADNVSGFYSVIIQPIASTVVTPGNTTQFIIRFSPTTMGSNYAVTIRIKTNSRDNDDFSFWVIGNSSDTYQIGDTGPGGGTVFFAQGGQYKECSTDLGTSDWTAAVATARAYLGGGKNDWALPTQSELDLMYQNLHKNNLGDFSDSLYWTSLQGTYTYNLNNAWVQNFSSGSITASYQFSSSGFSDTRSISVGSQSEVLKTSLVRFRAVRTFTF